jgi:hypothetical protein
LTATLLDHAVDHVDRARRGRSGREYEVALVGRPPEQPLHLRVVVAGVRVENGLAPRLLDAGRDRRRVHVVDLAARGIERLSGANQLVAGRDDPDPRFPRDRHLVDAERREQADLAGR